MTPPDARPRVLCVDDDANVLAALQRQLRGRYDVTLARGADAALARLADAGPFAVLVSDLHMPDVDGLALLARAREIAPATVGVLLTGSGGGDPHAVDTHGLAFACVGKPCHPEALWASLEAAVAHHRRGAPPAREEGA